MTVIPSEGSMATIRSVACGHNSLTAHIAVPGPDPKSSTDTGLYLGNRALSCNDEQNAIRSTSLRWLNLLRWAHDSCIQIFLGVYVLYKHLLRSRCTARARRVRWRMCSARPRRDCCEISSVDLQCLLQLMHVHVFWSINVNWAVVKINIGSDRTFLKQVR